MPQTTTGRPVDSSTRVTVAFPFSTIKLADDDTAGALAELAAIVAELAGAVEPAGAHGSASTDLAVRARALADRLAKD